MVVEVLEILKGNETLSEIYEKIKKYMEDYQNPRVWLDEYYMCIKMEHS